MMGDYSPIILSLFIPDVGALHRGEGVERLNMMMQMFCTDGKAFIVDDEDYDKVSGRLWYNNPLGYPTTTTSMGSVPAHVFIMGKAPDGLEWDHKDMDGFNNRKSNLRLATRSQNMANSKSRGGSSKFKGVYWDSWAKKYRAEITVNNKRIRLGRYISEEDAARAYDRAAKEYFGEFANTNFK